MKLNKLSTNCAIPDVNDWFPFSSSAKGKIGKFFGQNKILAGFSRAQGSFCDCNEGGIIKKLII